MKYAAAREMQAAEMAFLLVSEVIEVFSLKFTFSELTFKNLCEFN